MSRPLPQNVDEASEPLLDPPLRLGVSSCLLGEEVRFNGGHKRDRFLLSSLGPYVEWVPVCPEVEIGLGVPRESLRLVGDLDSPRLVAPKSGSDHTEKMKRWSREQEERFAEADLDGFILKRASPSCGVFRVKVYGKNGSPFSGGRGIFAAELVRLFPQLPVEEEGRLQDARLRENFIERLFAHSRFREFLHSQPRPGDLVRFHSAQKLTLLSHSPKRYRVLGRLVGSLGERPFEEILAEYEERYSNTLRVLATRGRHANVLQHILGFLKKALPSNHRAELVEQIEDYRLGLVPLVVPITLLRHHLRFHEVDPWILEQTYLNPYPKELMLRNSV